MTKPFLDRGNQAQGRVGGNEGIFSQHGVLA